jgi:chromosomal replication initiation ATPase DnaA
MYLARSETEASFLRIARAMGRVNHTGVVHAIKATQIRLERDPALVLRVEKLRLRLRVAPQQWYS